LKKELDTFVLLVVLCAVVAILNPRFLSPANLQNMARLIGAYGIFSIGLGIVIITGGIDLSVGSVFALLGVLLSLMLTAWGWPTVLAVVSVIAIAMLLGALHGLLITRLRLQPFIVTLCASLPAPTLLLAGISAIVFAFYTNSVSPSSHGNFFELYGIAAAVLGGSSLRGGEGSIIGILIGAALLQVLQNLVNILGIDSSLNFAVIGAVILPGVIADQILQRRTGPAF
jgi:ribose/xylose/arabinose/galactoside ABC-type transport system permease subunit